MRTNKESLEKIVQTYYLDKSHFTLHKSHYNGENMPNGTDYQSISWKTDLSHTPRNVFRQMRSIAYKPFRHFKDTTPTKYPLKSIIKGEAYYEFQKFYKVSHFWSGHFQLKNNLVIPKKTDLLYPCSNGFIHNSLTEFKEKKITIEEGLHPITMDYNENIVSLGTSNGKLILYNLDKQETVYNKVIIGNNSHNNCVTFFKQKGTMKLACGGDDNRLLIYDINNNDIKLSFETETEKSVNNIKSSPDGNLLIVQTDQKEVDVFDIRNGKIITKLIGHEDYGFTGDWHPDGIHIATGNQDCTCRIWDLRKPKKAVNILQAHLGSVSAVKYSKTGENLIVGENIDFTSIYNVENNYNDMQVIDYFGEVLGLNFDNEDGESLFFGVMLQKYNGIFEFNLKKAKYFNSLSNFMF